MAKERPNLNQLVMPEKPDGEPLASKQDIENATAKIMAELTIVKRLIQGYGARR